MTDKPKKTIAFAADTPDTAFANEVPKAKAADSEARTPKTREVKPAQKSLAQTATKTPRKWLCPYNQLPAYFSVKLAQLICIIYICIATFAYQPTGLRNPSTGSIEGADPEITAQGYILDPNGKYRPVVALGTGQMICLACSRISAFSLYPVMVLVFLSKCKATINFLEKSPFSMFMIKDMHDLHIYCGHYIAFDVWIHTFFHLLRWGLQGNISLLWTDRTGITGLVVIISTPLITFVMMYWKKQIKYEIRKGLHFLFYAFAIGMCFHVPPAGIPNGYANGGFCAYVLGFCITLYSLDALYVIFFMTEQIETTKFNVLPTGVQVTIEVSERFIRNGGKGGFGYICLPWVSRFQWHAFSIYQHPTNPKLRQMFLMKTGDWTTEVHAALQRNTSRPVWIRGPFESPYKMARFFDNQILVASGIGITPALSVIEAHKDSRLINLIWSVRDPAMLEFFAQQYNYLDHNRGHNLIFYTGKEPLNPALVESAENTTIITKRPDLEVVIPNIIHAVECMQMIPQKKNTAKFEAMLKVQHLLEDLDKGFSSVAGQEDLPLIQEDGVEDDEDKLLLLTELAEDEGFQLSDLLHHFEGEDLISPEEGDDTNPDNTLDASDALEKIRMGTVPYVHEEKIKGAGRKSRKSRKSKAARGRTSTMRIESCEAWKPNPVAIQKVKDLDKESVLATWGIMYCGGSGKIQDILDKIEKEYGIGLHSESFAW